MRQVTTDSNGVIAFASLNTGGGDSQQNFYRILSVSDGNVLYTQTRFQDVPLATTTNYLPTYPRLYYIVGEQVQIEFQMQDGDVPQITDIQRVAPGAPR